MLNISFDNSMLSNLFHRSQSRLFGNDEKTAADYEEPTVEHKSKEVTLTQQRITVVWRNGDEHSFTAFGEYNRSDSKIVYNIEPYWERRIWGKSAMVGGENVVRNWNRKRISMNVLGREPIVKDLAEVTYEINWTEKGGVVQSDSIEYEFVDVDYL